MISPRGLRADHWEGTAARNGAVTHPFPAAAAGGLPARSGVRRLQLLSPAELAASAGRRDLKQPVAPDQPAGVVHDAPARRFPAGDDHGIGKAEQSDPGPSDDRGTETLAAMHAPADDPPALAGPVDHGLPDPDMDVLRARRASCLSPSCPPRGIGRELRDLVHVSRCVIGPRHERGAHSHRRSARRWGWPST